MIEIIISNICLWGHKTLSLLLVWVHCVCSVIPTDRPEAEVQIGWVQQCPGLPGLLQDGQHDLVPQGRVEADDLLDVAEQLGGLRLGEQAAVLQVQQPAEEQLHRNEKYNAHDTLTQRLSAL